MLLKILGSSSIGNCYVLETEKEALIIECGVSSKEVKKCLDFDISKVCACVISHVHADHSKWWKEFADLGIPVYMGSETMISLKAFHPCAQAPFLQGMPVKIGNFTVTSFDNVHGCECLGYLIRHEEFGTLLFATDTEYIKYRFNNLNHVMVEANYSNQIIEDNASNRDHVLTGHMEIGTTVNFLKENNNKNLMNVVLLHLSEKNSNETDFKNRVKEVANCPVYVANKGMEIEIKKEPY